jgi:putative ABC transport system ATP-binding protein
VTIGRGEFVSLVGPSGSGKSTLLHLVGGLDVPTAGTVIVDGHRLSEMTDDQLTVFRRRHVGFVFQSFNLLPTLTAEENVSLPLLLEGHRSAELRDRARAALERVDMGHRARHRPHELSGGEMQRTAIARALVTDPLVVLADEPTGSLDTAMGSKVLELLATINQHAGVTIVLVTHDRFAAGFGSRTLTIRDGVIAEDQRFGRGEARS